MTLIEAAARALCRAEHARQFGPRAVNAESHVDRQWGQHVAGARAVIQAIREPSSAMQIAGHKYRVDPVTGEETFCGVHEIWECMISSLLTVDLDHLRPEDTK